MYVYIVFPRRRDFLQYSVFVDCNHVIQRYLWLGNNEGSYSIRTSVMIGYSGWWRDHRHFRPSRRLCFTGTKKRMPTKDILGGFSDPQIPPAILWGQKWTFVVKQIRPPDRKKSKMGENQAYILSLILEDQNWWQVFRQQQLIYCIVLFCIVLSSSYKIALSAVLW